jgi:hypothetical protein
MKINEAVPLPMTGELLFYSYRRASMGLRREAFQAG